jgi:ketosteroid isomerase-like protein
MKKTLFIFFLFILSKLTGQTNTDYLKEVNRDIWHPFIEAYNHCDIEKYKSLQTEDFIRAEGNGKRLPSFKDYFDSAGAWFDEIKKEGRKLGIAFRFSERFANGSVASERGIYELRSFNKEGKEVWRGYGKFHVFMRKIAEKWKIVVDYDSNEGNTINEQNYLTAFAMDDFEKY